MIVSIQKGLVAQTVTSGINPRSSIANVETIVCAISSLLNLFGISSRSFLSEFPNAEILKEQVLCLPIFPTMTEHQINKVISILKNIK